MKSQHINPSTKTSDIQKQEYYPLESDLQQTNKLGKQREELQEHPLYSPCYDTFEKIESDGIKLRNRLRRHYRDL